MDYRGREAGVTGSLAASYFTQRDYENHSVTELTRKRFRKTLSKDHKKHMNKSKIELC